MRFLYVSCLALFIIAIGSLVLILLGDFVDTFGYYAILAVVVVFGMYASWKGGDFLDRSLQILPLIMILYGWLPLVLGAADGEIMFNNYNISQVISSVEYLVLIAYLFPDALHRSKNFYYSNQMPIVVLYLIFLNFYGWNALNLPILLVGVSLLFGVFLYIIQQSETQYRKTIADKLISSFNINVKSYNLLSMENLSKLRILNFRFFSDIQKNVDTGTEIESTILVSNEEFSLYTSNASIKFQDEGVKLMHQIHLPSSDSKTVPWLIVYTLAGVRIILFLLINLLIIFIFVENWFTYNFLKLFSLVVFALSTNALILFLTKGFALDEKLPDLFEIRLYDNGIWLTSWMLGIQEPENVFIPKQNIIEISIDKDKETSSIMSFYSVTLKIIDGHQITFDTYDDRFSNMKEDVMEIYSYFENLQLELM